MDAVLKQNLEHFLTKMVDPGGVLLSVAELELQKFKL